MHPGMTPNDSPGMAGAEEPLAMADGSTETASIADANLAEHSPEAMKVLQEEGQEAWQRWVQERKL